jgi:glutathione-independent formaldehyde dehydrogenase
LPIFNCLKLPGEVGDEFEDDFVLLADVFSRGMARGELAHVHEGGSAAYGGMFLLTPGLVRAA